MRAKPDQVEGEGYDRERELGESLPFRCENIYQNQWEYDTKL